MALLMSDEEVIYIYTHVCVRIDPTRLPSFMLLFALLGEIQLKEEVLEVDRHFPLCYNAYPPSQVPDEVILISSF